jgi:hypothetical protein
MDALPSKLLKNDAALDADPETGITIERCATQSTGDALVEPDGIEPTTSCLQSRRSPN